MKDRFKHIRKVHFAEIPSIKEENYFLSVSNGLHIILTNNKKEEHRVYLPSTYMTDTLKYELCYDDQFSQRDRLAFHIFRFLMEKRFTKSQWKILYRLLRYSNNIFSAIKKLFLLLVSYYYL